MEPARCWTVPSPTHSHRITRMGLVGQGTRSHPSHAFPHPQVFLFLSFLPHYFLFISIFSSPLATPDLGTLGCTSGREVLRRSIHIWPLTRSELRKASNI